MGLKYIAQVAAEDGYSKIAPRTIETVNASTNGAARLGSLLLGRGASQEPPFVPYGLTH